MRSVVLGNNNTTLPEKERSLLLHSPPQSRHSLANLFPSINVPSLNLSANDAKVQKTSYSGESICLQAKR